jgi:hypothetical protein
MSHIADGTLKYQMDTITGYTAMGTVEVTAEQWAQIERILTGTAVQSDGAEADARLSAAAPKLLEALYFMLDRFEGRTANLFSQRLACTKARDAIAKATGEPK